jgi:hypothetical protein
MNSDNTDRPVIAPDVFEQPVSPSSSSSTARRRRQREVEYRFCVDQRGRQHFDFEQTIWLDRSVAMAFTRVYSTALKTLAANLLAHALDKSARAATELAPAFSRECLMGAPDQAWVLPKSTIEAWFESRQRRMRRQRKAMPRRRSVSVVQR